MPPSRVRFTILSIVSLSMNSESGTPAMVVYRTSGTIESPWPPRTSAWMSFTDTFSASAMNDRYRAVSRMPAMPITRDRSKPLTLNAT